MKPRFEPDYRYGDIPFIPTFDYAQPQFRAIIFTPCPIPKGTQTSTVAVSEGAKRRTEGLRGGTDHTLGRSGYTHENTTEPCVTDATTGRGTFDKEARPLFKPTQLQQEDSTNKSTEWPFFTTTPQGKSSEKRPVGRLIRKGVWCA
jgi:hypothetical protein